MDDQDSSPPNQNFSDDTLSVTGDVAKVSKNDGVDEHPINIGRYRIGRLLGRGGFGLVFLAYDDQLDRSVAIKVPHAKLVSRPEDAEAYLAEARTVAHLDHANIVPVFDMDRTEAYPCYIVSKYVDGKTLRERMQKSHPTWREAAELVAKIAEALHYAHKRGVVHRDIKPSNILLDKTGHPYVVDFGLALRESDLGKGSRYAGTPAYMSPEQARGEGHRVDGRSDVYSLGTVFYEMLVGRRTFAADSTEELLRRIVEQDVRPPRQVDDRIPKALENICLKALSKRASDRYTTALDMAQEIREFLDLHPLTGNPSAESMEILRAPSSSSQVGTESVITPHDSTSFAARIVPKGLCSFDEHDAEFFISLLPGPRDRSGLTDGIRFWKLRIEEQDADKTFSVGLIYGPSGCGKSSLVKAGLLPRLSQQVTTVYVEATANDTEVRLLNRLRAQFKELPEGLNLKQTLATIRTDPTLTAGRKVLLVLDQFEQWLINHRDQDTAMVHALRQCDGGNLQCIVMVRDDFWMAVTEFLAELEVDLIPDRNVAAASLFGERHSRRVLAAFGRAYGALPEDGQLSEENKVFLEKAVAGLAEGGKVICVRLALFAEMMKEKDWVPATLNEVGGTDGIGVIFLDETFSSPTAPPEHRLHQNAAIAVLGALLPVLGGSIRGKLCSYEELRAASGYGTRAKDFARLLEILDTELRLITPTDPDGMDLDQSSKPAERERYFQLTHDYLVPSLQQWLKRKQKETKRGRAEACLAERGAAWALRPASRDLPSWWEFMAICLYTNRSLWTDQQTKMLFAATRYFVVRMVAVLVLIGTVGWIFREGHARTKVSGFLDALVAAESSEVPEIIAEIEPYRRWVVGPLKAPEPASGRSPKARLHLDLAKLHFGILGHDELLKLEQRLLNSSPEDARLIADRLAVVAADRADSLWSVVEQSTEPREILAAATTLARHDPRDQKWDSNAALVAESLLAASPVHATGWVANLIPVGDKLVEKLTSMLDKPMLATSEEAGSQYVLQQRHVAATAIAVYSRNDVERICGHLVSHASDTHEFQSLIEPLYSQPEKATNVLRSAVQRLIAASEAEQKNDDAVLTPEQWQSNQQLANAVCALFLLDRKPHNLRLHLATSHDVTLRSTLIHRFAKLGIPAEAVVGVLATEIQPDVRAALFLSLGAYPRSTIARQLFDTIGGQIHRSLVASDAGERASAKWLAEKWDVAKVDASIATEPADVDRRNWSERLDGHCLVHFQNRLDHDFAIADREVTIDQYERFNPNYRLTYETGLEEFLLPGAPGACPTVYVSMYDAMKYCNWLSSKDGLPKHKWCYEEYHDGTFEPVLDYLEREGYRLPTREEWLEACRGDATTPFSFGSDLDLLGEFAWYYSNSRSHGQNRAQPVGKLKPNRFGLFDMYGNAWEWATEFGTKDSSILCGASCDNDPADLMATDRANPMRPEARQHRIGFRVAQTLKAQTIKAQALKAQALKK